MNCGLAELTDTTDEDRCWALIGTQDWPGMECTSLDLFSPSQDAPSEELLLAQFSNLNDLNDLALEKRGAESRGFKSSEPGMDGTLRSATTEEVQFSDPIGRRGPPRKAKRIQPYKISRAHHRK
ncbi:hypothetical protein B0H10DRAFT_2200185 [Mycena sp. CBHHK59/15]|nr:hypothetical protein B0H10DRAFT_2200185 [Mycena sp. CBHHK59/15]